MNNTLQKSLSELTAEAIQDFQKATLDSKAQDGRLLKTTTAGISTATGLVWFDLQTPAKNLFPVLTPLRNITPRVPGGGGTATNWRRVTAINALNQQAFVPEGRRGGVISTTADSKSASYKALGLEDLVTIEAELAAQSFEDIRAMTAQRLLWATMLQEEPSILGANTSVTIPKPAAPTLTKEDTGGTIAAATYNVRVVALSLMGFISSTVATGVVGSVTITNPTGAQYSFGGGASIKSDAAQVTTTTAFSVITAATPWANGALGFAWYVDDGAGGDLTLQAITAINSVRLTALTTSNQAMSTLFNADHSSNQYAYDGLLYQAFASGSNAYLSTLATGTPGVGTPLTADGAGGIVELNALCQDLWDRLRLGPTRIFVNSQQAIDISNKIVGSGGIFRFIADNPGTGLQNLMGGGRVKVYINKVGMDGNIEVPIEIHPNLPKGTLVAYTERLPYPMPNVTNVAEIRYQRDYYAMEWPMRERQYESGVYVNSVYAHYFPPSIGIINNIGNG